MSEPKKTKYLLPQPDAKGRRLAKVPLDKGLAIDGTLHKEIVLREANTGDLVDAEIDSPTSKPFGFSVALAARQIESVGSYAGPVTLKMLRGLSSADLGRVQAAQAELDAAGEDTQ